VPDLSAMANMLGGMGQGAGGMPDISSMMNNPAIMQMAQNMMANGGLERLMQNPALAGMVRLVGLQPDWWLTWRAQQMDRVQSGGGMPSMQELMGDPTLREL
jgi:small glutamine-rich tetratricopeptide repeat-containing protein alpha